MMDFKYRKAGFEDSGSISSLYFEVWKSMKGIFPDELLYARQPDKKKMREWMQKETYFICELKNQVVGAVGCFMEFGNCKLIHMAVLNEYQQNGIGSKLLEKVEHYAKKNNALKIWMDTSVRLTIAIDFYKKNNYEIVGKLKKHFWGEDIVIFEKLL
jgi:ribosomal protein S18 acetylase RimI-like enzyme